MVCRRSATRHRVRLRSLRRCGHSKQQIPSAIRSAQPYQVSLRSSYAHGILATGQQLVAESGAVNRLNSEFGPLSKHMLSTSARSKKSYRGHGCKFVSLSRNDEKMWFLRGTHLELVTAGQFAIVNACKCFFEVFWGS